MAHLFFLELDKEAWSFRTSFSKFSITNCPSSSKNRPIDFSNDDSRRVSSFLFLATKPKWYLSLYLKIKTTQVYKISNLTKEDQSKFTKFYKRKAILMASNIQDIKYQKLKLIQINFHKRGDSRYEKKSFSRGLFFKNFPANISVRWIYLIDFFVSFILSLEQKMERIF